MSAIPMPLLDRALEELPSDQLILATKLARQTLKDHLDECRAEINGLTEKNRRLQDELNEVSDDRNKKRSALASLNDKLARSVVGLFWERASAPNLPPPAIGRRKLVTLLMILEDPANFRHHVHCEVDGHDIFCAGGH